MNFSRGSEWMKWDLHIHAPTKYTCAKNDCFLGETLEEKQENFIKELETLTDIKVLGITDYFSLDGYKLILSNKERLSNIDLILPNIELRITPVTGENRKINLHIIPNIEVLSIEDIESFLHKFVMPPHNYTCKENHLIKYGELLEGNISEEAKFKRGLNEFVISYDKFFEVLNNETQSFKENVLVAVSNNSTDGASGIKDIQGIRNIIYNGVNVIFSGQPNDREYFIGKRTDSKPTIIEKYGKLIPCIHGSDYHGSKDGRTICIPDKKRFCWIKADTTFEGLKQIMFEPDDRVMIQENKPEDKTGYQVIDSIQLSGKTWNQEILLNQNLNTIIGGRSTGKSTLLTSIAKKINPKLYVDNEFIESLNSSIKINWKDTEEGVDRDIDYFEQNHMFNIAKSSEKIDELVSSIIKDRNENEIILNYNKFCRENKEYIESNINIIFKVRAELDVQNRQLKEMGDKLGVEKEILKLGKEIELLSQKTEEQSKLLDEYAKLSERILILTNVIEKYKNDINELNYQKGKEIFDTDVIYRLNSLSDELRREIIDFFEVLKLETQTKWNQEIESKIDILTKSINEKQIEIDRIKEEKSFADGKKILEENKAFEEFQNKLKIEKEKLEKIKEMEKGVSVKEKQLSDLKEKIIYSQLLYKEKIEKLKNEFSIEAEGIKFNVEVKFSKDNLDNFLKERLNLQGNEKQKYIVDFVENFKDDTKNKIEEFLNKALNREFDFKSIYKNKESLVTNELLSENWYKISFDLVYQNDKFFNMSQGKQAFVILKLLLEFSGKRCPILIDQPEDSLDNRAIYNELVQYIKTKKKERQVILVTHNPNIVVGADAEQVIVANQHGENSKNTNGLKFQYVAGSLENTKKLDLSEQVVLKSQGIREHVCDVLEGGNIAFKKREEKYNIK
ncbi:TrlF family AAA-like ATPase [Serpentinicella alkaliphila]|uniref:ATPase AAA-type core domain-containing protein n=1 Tax=Serpentinicella alkaliphila TaxID=1734049 RepID=A0A4R2SXB7_9FIRM|nr:ATP-binding protein [Serpentinicella alkaliphila]QUH26150.1 hypothetical protein HZR23_10665 [Serpentinicella alkaliphila]TCP93551.1 hypothetical protein EDD79_10756 [Serpentinicella alkaliphila]